MNHKLRKFPPQNISILNILMGACLTCPCLQAELEEDGEYGNLHIAEVLSPWICMQCGGFGR